MSQKVKRYGKILILSLFVLTVIVAGWLLAGRSLAKTDTLDVKAITTRIVGDKTIGLEKEYNNQYYVAPDGKDNWKGTSWAKPFKTIQKGIDTAGDGDIVWVAAGTYQENIDFLGKSITVSSVNPQDPNVVLSTVIDGSSDTASTVSFITNEDNDTMLSGLTITGGQATYGGGIFCYQVEPVIIDCIIADNTADYGGGIYLYQSDAVILDCFIGKFEADKQRVTLDEDVSDITLNGNSADYGGGIYGDDSTPILECCTILVNSATDYVGGIYNNTGRPVLDKCLIWGNSDSEGINELAQIYDGRPYVDNSNIQGWSGQFDPNGVGNEGILPYEALSVLLPTYDALDDYTFGLIGMMRMGMDYDDDDERVYNEDDDEWFPYIQDAINAASSGDTLVVEPNEYYENIYLLGKDITIESTDPNDPDIVATTIIDGYSLDATVNFDGAEESDTVLEGLTITSTRSAPVVHFALDESSGTIAYDDSYYQRDGTLTNMSGTEWTSGQMGNALDFDRSNEEYVDIDGYAGVTGTQSRTVSAWIKTDYSSANTLFITGWGADYNNGKRWLFNLNTSGYLKLGVHGGYVMGSTDLRDGFWHHVAVVLDSDGTPQVDDIELFVDGVAISVTATNGSQAIDTAGDDDVHVGATDGLHSGYYFDGLIDDFRIYDRALYPEEIAVLASYEARWEFDETTGAIASDSSSNGYDGTLNNTPTWTNDAERGRVLSFDSSSSEYVKIDGGTSGTAYNGITGTNPRTISAWVNVDNGSSSNDQLIASWGSSSTGAQWNFRISDSASGGKLEVGVYSGELTGSTGLRDGNWHHVAATWENDTSPNVEDVLLYVDGVLETTSAVTSRQMNTGSANNIYIGVKIGGGSYFDGMMDDVRIYPRVLDKFEIQKLYIDRGYVSDGGIDGAGAAATITKCVIRDNYSADSGGGIRDFDGTISKSYIYRNEAYNYGGGVYASDATITNTVIYDNTAYYGGGL
ncbi:MAG: DUF1565 domain-containing protein, partial [Planctomycetes bacterium]|nr:DUF1565 domain-containing protein [Planctomycetota bacterium]